MKKIALLLIVALFAGSAFAADKKLTKKTVPVSLNNAVATIYDIGRGEGDAGGLFAVAAFQNKNGMQPFEIVKEIMFNEKLMPEAAGMAQEACYEMADQNTCVRGVLESNEDVKANYQFNDVLEFTADLRGWAVDDTARWEKAIQTVEDRTLQIVGEGYKAYAYGVDGPADAFTIILISEDEKTILVYMGDYGA